MYHKSDVGDVLFVDPDLIELTHDEHRHPHEVEDTVEEHPEHPGRAGGDLGQIEPEPILGVIGGTVDPPILVGGDKGRGEAVYRAQRETLVAQPKQWFSTHR